MATLLHFLGSLVFSLLVSFLLTLSALVGGLSGLTLARASLVGAIAQPLHGWMREFLTAFGGGNCWGGTIAISLAVGIVSALWHVFGVYKHMQRSTWRMTAAGAFTSPKIR